MKAGKLPIYVAAFVIGLLLLPMLAWQMVPGHVVKQFAVSSLLSYGVKLEAQRFTTTFPFGVKAEGLSIGDQSAVFLNLDSTKLNLALLPLFTGAAKVKLSGKIAAGDVNAVFFLYPKVGGTMQVENLALASLPALSNVIKGNVQGTLNLEAAFKSISGMLGGEAKLRINAMSLSKATVSSMPLPDMTVPETRGLLQFNGPLLSIPSLAFQGEGIYLRLSGTVPLISSAPLSLSLELMPSAELMERQKSVFLIMFPYLISPGNYKLPIGGTLANPQLSMRK